MHKWYLCWRSFAVPSVFRPNAFVFLVAGRPVELRKIYVPQVPRGAGSSDLWRCNGESRMCVPCVFCWLGHRKMCVLRQSLTDGSFL